VNSEYLKAYYRQKKPMIQAIWAAQNTSSRLRGHPPPTYTLNELREWCLSQRKFHTLWRNWKKVGYPKALKPSIDRLDNSRGYSFDNIQIVTARENLVNSVIGRNKKFTFGLKVNQLDADGNVLATYINLKFLTKVTGICHNAITKAIKQKTKYRGYYWGVSPLNTYKVPKPNRSHRGKLHAQLKSQPKFCYAPMKIPDKGND